MAAVCGRLSALGHAQPALALAVPGAAETAAAALGRGKILDHVELYLYHRHHHHLGDAISRGDRKRGRTPIPD